MQADYKVFDAGGDRLVIVDQVRGKLYLPHGTDRVAAEDLARAMTNAADQQHHEKDQH
jgi:hypothetical protein